MFKGLQVQGNFLTLAAEKKPRYSVESVQLKCTVIWKPSRQCGQNFRHFPDDLESFQTTLKVSRQSKNMSDNLITFQTILKVFTQSEKFEDNLEIFQTIRNFPDNLESLQTTMKHSRNLESFQSIWKGSRQSGNFPDYM